MSNRLLVWIRKTWIGQNHDGFSIIRLGHLFSAATTTTSLKQLSRDSPSTSKAKLSDESSQWLANGILKRQNYKFLDSFEGSQYRIFVLISILQSQRRGGLLGGFGIDFATSL